ncbi:MAG: sigma-E processing peptidase SpoIIGA [Lachnospiraceae bacterium]|nr:sigma-E processing peptidase SpoIIGA [Lachnospiraceae bacterium]
MQCEIYLDSIFLIQFLLNFYLLFAVNLATHKTASGKRLVLGSVVGAVFGCSYYLLPVLGDFKTSEMFAGIFRGSFWKLFTEIFRGTVTFGLGTLAMIRCTFPIGEWKAFWMIGKKMLLFSFFLGGGVLVLRQKLPGIFSHPEGMILVLFLGVIGCLFLGKRLGREGEQEEKSICVAILKNRDKQLKIQALVDSGSFLIEPVSQQHVCVVDSGVFEALFDENVDLWRAIPYRSLGCKKGILKGYRLEELILMPGGIRKTYGDVYIAVSPEPLAEPIRMILPAALLDKNC